MEGTRQGRLRLWITHSGCGEAAQGIRVGHRSGMSRHPDPLPKTLLRGPFTAQRARELGVSAGRLRANDLATPFRGVRTADTAVPSGLAFRRSRPDDHPEPLDIDFTPFASTPEHRARLMYVCTAYASRMPDTQYFSHLTAAMLWGIPLPHRLEGELPVHVSAMPGSREPRMRGVAGHRGSEGADLFFIGGLRVLGPCDTWCQLGRLLGTDELIIAGGRLFQWRDHLTTPEQLAKTIERMSQQAGIRNVRRALGELREDSNSPREVALQLQVKRAGFPEPELNGEIWLSNGKRTWGDLVFRKYKTLMEFDGKQHRTDERQWQRDVERLNDLIEDGWLIIRVQKGSRDHLDRLARTLRKRGWRPA